MPVSRPHDGHRLTRPEVGVGGIVVKDDAVLLVCRGRPPYAGQWAIPGGRLNAGEPLLVAVARELREETGVAVRPYGPAAFSFEHIEHDGAGALLFHYVVLDYRAEYLSGEPCAGDDADQAAWVRFAELHKLPINSITLDCLRQVFPERF